MRGLVQAAGLFAATAALGSLSVAATYQVTGKADASQTVLASGDGLFPSDTATDWAAIADHLVEVQVLTETPIAARPEDVATGEWIELRHLTAAVVDVYWSRDGAPTVPSTMTWKALGWEFKDGNKSLMDFYGSPRIKPGQTYLMPVVALSFGPTGLATRWSPLDTKAVYNYGTGFIKDPLATPEHVLWADEYEGLGAPQLADAVESAAQSLNFPGQHLQDPVARTEALNDARPPE